MTAPMTKCTDPNCYIYVQPPATRCPSHAASVIIPTPAPIPSAITPPPYVEKITSGIPVTELAPKPQVNDPWANLGTYACRTCRFFVPKDPGNGRCRRHAPTMEGYPVVYAEDWCGDHKLGTNPSRSQ